MTSGSQQCSVRPIQQDDITPITEYWTTAGEDFLRKMGADINKVPAKEAWQELLSAQIGQPFAEKKSYCTIWLLDGQPVGHCNVNKIVFGKEAYMHLHIWNEGLRLHGYGAALVKRSLPYFFEDLQLQELYCEPYALNPAPNKTLKKVGFELVKEYDSTPGFLNFEQPVKLWRLSRESYLTL